MEQTSWRDHLSALKSKQASPKKRLERGQHAAASVAASAIIVTPLSQQHTNANKENVFCSDPAIELFASSTPGPLSFRPRDFSSSQERHFEADRALEITSSMSWAHGNTERSIDVAKALNFGETSCIVDEVPAVPLQEDKDPSFEARTPPRAPPRRPSLTKSPSSTNLNSKTITPSHITLPCNKDSSRLRVSPTRNKTESDFGRQLQAEEHADQLEKEKEKADRGDAGQFDKLRQQQNEQQQQQHQQKQEQKQEEWKEARTQNGKV